MYIVKTLKNNVTLPNGIFYAYAQSTAELTDAEYDSIAEADFGVVVELVSGQPGGEDAVITLAPSFSMTGDLTVMEGKHSFHNDTGTPLKLTAARASVGTAPTGSGITVLVKKNGTTAATITLAAGATTAKVSPASQTLADGDALTVSVSAIGSTTPGADLTVTAVLRQQ